jgi:hypothetical protein
MATPWFDPNSFGMWYGTIAGGGGGSLLGILGALAGRFAPRGKGKRWVLGGLGLALTFGLVSLGTGVAALATGQPYGIWYPLTLVGGIFAFVVGFNLPVVRRRYAEAEARKLEAGAIRNG